jgi:hypothetical protein
MRGKAIGSPAMAKPPNKRPGEVSVRGLQRLIALKYERDPKRGTRGKPGGFLLIWPAMGLDARFSAPWFHPVIRLRPLWASRYQAVGLRHPGQC